MKLIWDPDPVALEEPEVKVPYILEQPNRTLFLGRFKCIVNDISEKGPTKILVPGVGFITSLILLSKIF